MANSANPGQLASSELVWIYTVSKGRVYPGSAGQGFINTSIYSCYSCYILMTNQKLNHVIRKRILWCVRTVRI